VAEFLAQPEQAAFLLYLQTGRNIRPAITPKETLPAEAPPTTEPIAETTAPREDVMEFSPEDAQLVQVSNFSGLSVDPEALLLTQLALKTPEAGPAVLIIHSHGTESYTQTAQLSYTPAGDYRTLDEDHNMLRVGDALQKALEARGISVLHDRNLHDYPSYPDAYINSRKTVQQYLEDYPTLCLVIDLHRDAADTAGGQLTTTATVEGRQSSQLMLVVGSNAGGRTHGEWEKNLALAVQLHARLEKRYPGICRPISLRKERFNQDLSPGALLIEVGAAGDTLEKALNAVEALAWGIGELLAKTDSTR
jgi:stage II sporulation protein P